MDWEGTSFACTACGYVDSEASGDASAAVSTANSAASQAGTAAGLASSSMGDSAASESASESGDSSWESAGENNEAGDAQANVAHVCVITAEQCETTVNTNNNNIAATEQSTRNEKQNTSMQQRCSYCGAILVEGNPVNVVNGAKIEGFTDLEIAGQGNGINIERNYNSQNGLAMSLGLGNTFNYDTRIIFGVKYQAQEAYDFAVLKYNEAVQALANANSAIASAISAYSAASSAYGSAASSYASAADALERAAELLEQAQEALDEAITILEDLETGKGGGCPDVIQAIIDASQAIGDAGIELGLAQTAYNEASSRLGQCYGSESSALSAKADVDRKLAQFRDIEAPQIRKAIQDVIDYLEIVKVQMKKELDIANAQKARNKYVLDNDVTDQQLIGNRYAIWIDDTGVERIFKADADPDPLNIKRLPDGEMNVWPAGSSFSSLYGRDFIMNVDPDGTVVVKQEEEGTTYSYSCYGRLTRIEDRNGNFVSVNFDDRHLKQISDRYGRTVTATTNPEGRITSLRDFTGRTIGYAYTGKLLTSFTDAERNVYGYTYDANSNLNSQINPDRTARSYIYNLYDEKYKVVEETDELGNKQYFDYYDKLTIHTDRRGYKKEYHFDENYNIVKVVDRDGSVINDVFNTTRDLILRKDKAGYEHGYACDAEGHATAETLPTGAAISRTFHEVFGKPINETVATSRGNNNIEYRYNEKGDPEKILFSNPLTGEIDESIYVEYGYDSRGRVDYTRDKNNVVTNIVYDDKYPLSGSTITTTRENDIVVFTFDELGRTTGYEHGDMEATYEYDKLGRLVKETYEGGDRDKIVRYEYNYHGVKKQTGPYYANSQPEYTIEYGYDEARNLESVIETESGKTRISQYSYDKESNLTETTLPDGRKMYAEYDEVGKTIETGYYKDGQKIDTRTYEYDDAGRILEVKENGVAQISLSYPNIHTEIEKRFGEELTIRRETDDLGRIERTVYTSADGEKIEQYQYDLAGRLTDKTIRKGNVTGYEHFDYDIAGRLEKHTGVNGGVTTLVYDGLDRLRKITGPEGEETEYFYNQSGRLQKTIDAEKAETQYLYDPLGRIKTILFPGGSTECYEYDAFDRVTKKHGRNGQTSSITYGPLGLYVEATDPELSKVRIEYDTAGKKTKEIGPRGETINYEYDPSMGNLTRVLGAEGEDTRFEYDELGYVTAKKLIGGSEQRVENYARDSYGRLTGITGEEGYNASYVYDYNGRLRKLVQYGNGQDKTPREWTYDVEGLLVKEQYQLDGITQTKNYTWSLDGNLKNVKNFRGQEIGYQYDLSSRLTQVNYPGNEWYKYQYDKNGRLKYTNDSIGHSETYNYDPDGNLLNQTDETGNRLDYAYNPAGELLNVTGANKRVDYLYDKVGRTKELTVSGNEKVGFQYDKSGNLVKVEYNFAGKVVSDYTYDLSSRMKSYRSLKGTGNKEELTDGFLYFYDKFGDIAYETDENGFTTAYGYDGRDRLEKVWYPAGRGDKQTQAQDELTAIGIDPAKKINYTKGIPGPEAEIKALYNQVFGEWKNGPNTFLGQDFIDETLTYDTYGRRTNKSTAYGSISYAYDTQDRMLSAGNRTLAYDADGNRTDEFLPGKKEKDNLWKKYEYRADNRLVKYTDSEGEAWAYMYDGMGRRTEKTNLNPKNNECRTEYTDYLGLGTTVASLSNNDGEQIDYFIGPFGRAYGAGKSDYHGAAWKQTEFYQYDIRGSVTQVSYNKSGNKYENYYYGPFGELMQGKHGAWGWRSDGSKAESFARIGYTGTQADVESSTYHFVFREYDPLTAQFTTEDPVKDGDVWYALCGMNTVNRVDTLGLDEHSNGNCISFIKKIYGPYFEYLQKKINELEEKAKNKKDFNEIDRNFVIDLYKMLSTGGLVTGYPEASSLLYRYISPSLMPAKIFNRGGQKIDDPFMIDSGIYKQSKIVKYAMENMKKIIKTGYINNEINNYVDIDSSVLKITDRNIDTEGNILPDGRLLVEQNNKRLKYTDHRFKLNSHSEKLPNGKIKTTWFVLSRYEFASYPDKMYSEFKISEDISLTIDDGLSQYLTELGIAEEFYHMGKWEEIWDPKLLY